MSKVSFRSIESKAQHTPKRSLNDLSIEMYGIPYDEIDSNFDANDATAVKYLINKRR